MTTTVQPPAEAVAKDVHWATTLDRLRARQRPTATLRICDDQDAKMNLAEAQAEQRRLQRFHEGETTAAAKKALRDAETAVTRAQAAVDDASIVLTFRALERTALDALKRAHPPTEEQAEDGFEINADTLGPALVAASNTDGMTEEQAGEFLDTWSDAEAGALFSTAWNVQLESRLDLGKG
ncbi:hypothetical protein OG301_39305 (plasmid) [Streptomyces platensis]|uniref:hypothetical protein n=1 Tax=Streptomyces platensis TaxID=58346 RepID=UPI002ED07B74|nr:hypothetical protein OG301_39305 [Streptomyces platensis]